MSTPLPMATCPHCQQSFGLASKEYLDLWTMLVGAEHVTPPAPITLSPALVRSMLLHIESLRAEKAKYDELWHTEMGLRARALHGFMDEQRKRVQFRDHLKRITDTVMAQAEKASPGGHISIALVGVAEALTLLLEETKETPP